MIPFEHLIIIIDKKDAAKTIAASFTLYDFKRIQISHGFKERVWPAEMTASSVRLL